MSSGRAILLLACLSGVVLSIAAMDVSDLASDYQHHAVVVYAKSYCPYCRRTLQLLESLNVDVVVYQLDTIPEGRELQRRLTSRTGQRTVPMVFIGGELVGGNDDLQKLHAQGKLVPLLESAQGFKQDL